MKKVFIGIGVAAAVLIALWVFVIDPPRTDYYTQIDNLKCKENLSDGGIVDITGGMKYLYTLKSYTSSGKEKEITFGTDKILKDKAFLKLEYTTARGVLAWCEVGREELPKSLQSVFEKP